MWDGAVQGFRLRSTPGYRRSPLRGSKGRRPGDRTAHPLAPARPAGHTPSMGSYPINVRLWLSFTAALCVGFVAWSHWRNPRKSPWTEFVNVVTGNGPTGLWLVDGLLLLYFIFASVVIAAVIGYAICAPATHLARRPTPSPASPQAADYDDRPPARRRAPTTATGQPTDPADVFPGRWTGNARLAGSDTPDSRWQPLRAASCRPAAERNLWITGATPISRSPVRATPPDRPTDAPRGDRPPVSPTASPTVGPRPMVGTGGARRAKRWRRGGGVLSIQY